MKLRLQFNFTPFLLYFTPNLPYFASIVLNTSSIGRIYIRVGTANGG